MNRRTFLKGILGTVGLLMVNPLNIFPCEHSVAPVKPVAVPVTPAITISEYGRSVPYQLFQWQPWTTSVKRNHALSQRLRYAAIAETKMLRFVRDEQLWQAHEKGLA